MLDLLQVKKLILNKTLKNVSKFGDLFPTCSYDGKYKLNSDMGWTGSFWTGLNYLCYEMSDNKAYLEAARASRWRFKKKLYEETETLHHDTGFLYSLSCVADYKLTGDMEARLLALDAAEVLVKRFNKKGNFIQAWPIWGGSFGAENRGRIIIDCMYNLPLLFWAWKESGDDRFLKAADVHAETASKTLVRDDYTTFHTFLFDPDTGETKQGSTFQGYSDDSCWSRGQAWAIGGYAYAYGYTGRKEYLEISKKCAQVFINNLEDDYIPMWDFRLPSKEEEPRDTTAAACAASGMLELAKHLEDADEKYFSDMACSILESLFNKYSTKDSDDEGLILHGCGFRMKNIEIDNPIIYGDYYFAEAIARLSGKKNMYW